MRIILSFKPIKVTLFFIIVSTLVFGSFGGQAWAEGCPQGLSTNDCQALLNDWVEWIPNTCNTDSGSTTLVGSDNIQKAFNYFVRKGLTAAQSAGIIGNLIQESGVNPKAEQKSGSWNDLSNDLFHAVGIAQWDGSRRPDLIKNARAQGQDPQDFGYQLDYMWSELSDSSSQLKNTLTELRKITGNTPDDASKAADVFNNLYERSADKPGSQALVNRENNAKDVLAKYGSSVSGTSVQDVCTNSNFVGADFVQYKQCNDRRLGIFPTWVNNPYDARFVAVHNRAVDYGTICTGGCGPSAMAMIVTNLLHRRITPADTAAYGMANGTALYGGGSLWTVGPVIGEHWGLHVTEVGFDTSDIPAINAALHKGALILATGRGPLPFSTVGHFLVVRAVTSDNKWLLGNSMTGIGDTLNTKYNPEQLTTSTASHHNAWIVSL